LAGRIFGEFGKLFVKVKVTKGFPGGKFEAVIRRTPGESSGVGAS